VGAETEGSQRKSYERLRLSEAQKLLDIVTEEWRTPAKEKDYYGG